MPEKLKLKSVETARVKPYWRNPRDISAEAVDAVKASIEKYGYQQPIVVDRKLVIIAGHTRYRAMLALKRKRIEVVVADLPPEKAKEYRLADNKAGEISTWNLEHLSAELREIKAPDVRGLFKDLDLDKLLGAGKAAVQQVTEASLARGREKLDAAFKEKGSEMEGRMVEVACPKCGSEFSLDRAELLNIPGVEKL